MKCKNVYYLICALISVEIFWLQINIIPDVKVGGALVVLKAHTAKSKSLFASMHIQTTFSMDLVYKLWVWSESFGILIKIQRNNLRFDVAHGLKISQNLKCDFL